MRIAEHKKIGSHKEQRVIHHGAVYDEFSGVETESAYDETIEIDVPEMGWVHRDMTPEEAEAAEEAALIEANRQPTLEEQVSDLTDLVTILTEVIAND